MTLAIPSVDGIRKASLDQSARIGAALCARMDNVFRQGGDPSAGETYAQLCALIGHEDGARGFFSTYLTDDKLLWADATSLPVAVRDAIDEAPRESRRALMRSLVYGAAGWTLHSSLRQEALVAASSRTTRRAVRLLAALSCDDVLSDLRDLRAVFRVPADLLASGKKGRKAAAAMDGEDNDQAMEPPEADVPDACCWHELTVDVRAFTAAQKVAVGAAIDAAIHLRLVAGGDAASPPTGHSGVRVDLRDSGVMEVVLSRGARLNALSADMVTALRHVFARAASDPAISAVLLVSDDGNAFCAGGDVVALATVRSAEGRCAFLHEEYAAIGALRAVAALKPVVAVADGVTMGAGLGLFMAANRRVVGDAVRMAMPETAIGIVPDGGALHHLSHYPPGLLGAFLAMTGYSMDVADALYTALATARAPSDGLAELVDALRASAPEAIDAALAAACEPPPGRSALASLQTVVDAACAAASEEEVGACSTYGRPR